MSAARGDLLRLDLLGRRVVDRADEDARLRQPALGRAAALLRDAEVHQVDAAGLVLDHHVGRLDVAMDHLARVGGVERARDLLEDRERLVRIVRAALLDQLLEVGPLHVAHRDVDEALVIAGVVDRDDVRVVDRGDRLRLADEALAEVGAAAELGRQRLERGLAPEQQVLGLVDEAHAAAPEQAGDAVAREDGFGFESAHAWLDSGRCSEIRGRRTALRPHQSTAPTGAARSALCAHEKDPRTRSHLPDLCSDSADRTLTTHPTRASAEGQPRAVGGRFSRPSWPASRRTRPRSAAARRDPSRARSERRPRTPARGRRGTPRARAAAARRARGRPGCPPCRANGGWPATHS